MGKHTERFGVVGVLGAMFTSVLVGCGQAEGDSGRNGDTGGAVGSTFSSFTLTLFGGFGSSPPPDSSCDLQSDPTTKTVVAASKEFSYRFCQTTGETLWTLRTGSGVLGSRQFSLVTEALQRVTPSDAKTCGADAGIITLDVETPSGVRRFVDDFYSGCPSEIHAGRTFATGLPDLSRTLNIFQLK